LDTLSNKVCPDWTNVKCDENVEENDMLKVLKLQPLTDADHEWMHEHEHGFRRGFADGYDRALGGLCKLREAGHRDVWAMVAIAEAHLRDGELRDWVRARPRAVYVVPPLLVVEPAH
jgi:hypothetical protein